MRHAALAGALALTVVLAVAPNGWAQAAASAVKASAKAAAESGPPEPPIQSGIYGFSGAKTPDADPRGVVGECIWIYDAQNRNQIAKGDCYDNNPGTFRVVLKPGRYVVHGPGGNKPVDIKEGGWVKVVSIATLPVAP